MTLKKPLALVEGQNIPVNPILASELGFAAAYLLQELHYGLESEGTAGYVDPLGLKWIYNSFKDWGARLGIKDSLAGKAIRELLKRNLIYECRPEEKQRRWDQTPHYRINYAVLRDFLVSIGLKLALDAWREKLGHENGQVRGSTPDLDGGSKQRLRQRGLSKGKQQQAAAAAFSADAVGNLGATSEQDPLPAADRGVLDQEDPSVNGAPTENATLPPAPAGQADRLEAVLQQLGHIKISQKAGMALIEEFSLETVEHQLKCLPYRRVKTTKARLLIGSLRGNYDTPAQLASVEEKAQAEAHKSELREKITAFVQSLVPGQSKLQHPVAGLLEVIGWNHDTVQVLRGQEKTFVPIEYAMNWGLAMA